LEDKTFFRKLKKGSFIHQLMY